jgi:methyl-accepting chemotaxis protein
MALFVFEQTIDQILSVTQQTDTNLKALLMKVELMSQATDNLAAAVQRAAGVDQQILAEVNDLITQNKALTDQIASLSTDPQVQALADQLNQNTDSLAAALTANPPVQTQG